jgi:hypothetical protein
MTLNYDVDTLSGVKVYEYQTTLWQHTLSG